MADPVNDVPSQAEGKEGTEVSSWKDSLPGDIKNSPHLANLSHVEALAKSYISAADQLSKSHPGPTKEDTWDVFATKTRNFFHLPEKVSEYKHTYKGTGEKEVGELAHKYNLHPLQVKPFVEGLKKAFDGGSKLESSKRIESWKEQSSEVFKDVEGKDEVIGRAFKKMGVTREDFEKELGGVSHHPTVNKMLLALGKNPEVPSTVKSTQGSTPSVGEQEKFKFLKEHLNNQSSPYWNNQHPDHYSVRIKVDSYTRDLSDYQSKNPDKADNFRL